MLASDVGGQARPDGFTTGQFLLLYVGFAALVTWVYRAALQGPFVADDSVIYVTNPYTTAPTLENLLAILDPWGDAMRYSWNYAPLHLLLSAAQIQVFGAEMLGYHLVNVLLHALCALLLVALLASSQLPRGAALLGGLLFAFHPANVEAVAWAFQLKNVVAMSLGLGALLSLGRAPGWATLLFALALLTRITAAAFLPMAAAFLWARGWSEMRGSPWRWLGAWLVLVAAVAIPQLDAFSYGGGLELPALADPQVRLRTTVAFGAQYLGMAATGLGVSAYHEPPPASSWLDPRWLAGLALCALLAWRLLYTLWHRREEAAWWLGAAAGFLPVSQVASFRYPVADRYLYFMLPGLIGGALLFLHTTGRAWLRRVGSERLADAAGRAALIGGAALALCFALHSARRATLWVEPFRLFVDAAVHYPEGSQANYVRAVQ